MEYREYAPSAALAPYVRCYWTLRGTGNGWNRVFPDGYSEFIFHLGDAFEIRCEGAEERQNLILLGGQLVRPIELRATGAANVIGVRFLPGGAHPFLRFPQTEATGRVMDLESAWGRAARDLRQRLGESRHPIRTLETALLACHPAPRQPLDALSPRQRRRRFEAEVGISPKLHQRILRFQKALQRLGSEPAAGTAAECGYFDQAHLIRDFKEFAGVTPSAYLRESGRVLFFQDASDDLA